MKKLTKTAAQMAQATLYGTEGGNCMFAQYSSKGFYVEPPKNTWAIDVYGKSLAERENMINGAISQANAMGGYTDVVVYSRTSLPIASYNIEAVIKSGKSVRLQ